LDGSARLDEPHEIVADDPSCPSRLLKKVLAADRRP
jgi:hypothetical protein